LAELPSEMTHGSVPAEERALLGMGDDLIRLSVGIEESPSLFVG
jgi:cystathionine gamma-lyase